MLSVALQTGNALVLAQVLPKLLLRLPCGCARAAAQRWRRRVWTRAQPAAARSCLPTYSMASAPSCTWTTAARVWACRAGRSVDAHFTCLQLGSAPSRSAPLRRHACDCRATDTLWQDLVRIVIQSCEDEGQTAETPRRRRAPCTARSTNGLTTGATSSHECVKV